MKVLTTKEELLSLPKNTKLYHINKNNVSIYEFLTQHTHNPEYVFLVEIVSMDAPKFYINSMLDGNWYIGESQDSDWSEIYDKLINYHLELVETYRKRKERYNHLTDEQNDNKEIVE